MHITIEKQLNGSYLVSTIRNDQYIKQVYYGYTKKEAIAEFKQYIKNTYV